MSTSTGPVDWKGLFEWSMKHQEAPRAPGSEGPKVMSEQDRKWFEEAMEHYSLDITKRMKEIKRQLDAAVGIGTGAGESDGGGGEGGGAVAPADAAAGDAAPAPAPPAPSTPALTPAALEELLDELVETVEDVDCARDLALIGGLPTLLALLRAGSSAPAPASPSSSSPSSPLVTSGVVARAAEALGAAAQCNPPVQDWFLDGGALEALLGLLRAAEGGGEGGGAAAERASSSGVGVGGRADTERSAEVRQKALMAVSCLVRNCDRGTDALVAAGGVGTIVEHALAAVGESAAEGGKGAGGGGGKAAAAGAPAPRVARKAFQLLASLFRDRPTEACLGPALRDASFARAAARALRDGDEEEQGGGGGGGEGAAAVRLAAAAAAQALASAASEAGLSLSGPAAASSTSSPSSSVSSSVPLLLRAALETAESSARERAERAAKKGDEHAKDWAEEEAAAAAAALGALSLKPGEEKKKTRVVEGETEDGKKPAIVLSLPAPPSSS